MRASDEKAEAPFGALGLVLGSGARSEWRRGVLASTSTFMGDALPTFLFAAYRIVRYSALDGLQVVAVSICWAGSAVHLTLTAPSSVLEMRGSRLVAELAGDNGYRTAGNLPTMVPDGGNCSELDSALGLGFEFHSRYWPWFRVLVC